MATSSADVLKHSKTQALTQPRMQPSTMEAAVAKYFKAWNAKDQVRLSECLCKNATLTDWDVSIRGREEVLQANANIWKLFPKVKITVQDIFISEISRVASCEITVHLDGEDASDTGNVLKVVDILRYGEAQQIFAIRAYKQ